jgi:hypothetical protein
MLLLIKKCSEQIFLSDQSSPQLKQVETFRDPNSMQVILVIPIKMTSETSGRMSVSLAPDTMA